MSIAVQGAARAASTARAAGLAGRRKSPAIQLTWSRIAKLGGALSLLGVGAYAIMSDQIAIATDNAVVSAYAVTLRTPIDGVVGGTGLRIGQSVSRGTVLAQVDNSRIDDQRLVDLREHLTRARASLDATAAEIQSLGALRDNLQRRSMAYLAASAARLAGSIIESGGSLAVIEIRHELGLRNLARRSTLAKDGIASVADLERAQADVDTAAREIDAQKGRLASLRAQADAVANGIISEPGSNDVAYSSQRADEIAIRLDELKREHALTQADIAETLARLASEEPRMSKLKTASLIAPASGMVWKLNASDGERLGTGDSVAQIVDCDSSFIIASVPQNRVPDIEIGGLAEYRLSGDGQKRQGRVLSVTGDATGGDRNLAAIPFEQKGASTATVRIALEPVKGLCLVGRTARVLLPASGNGVARLLSRFL